MMEVDGDAYAAGVRDTLNIVEQLAVTSPATLVLATSGVVSMKRLADAIATLDPAALHVLRPFDPAEAIGPKEAAGLAGVSESAIRGWVERYRIGRRVVGSLRISRVALATLLDDNPRALACYLSGDRSSPVIGRYVAHERFRSVEEASR